MGSTRATPPKLEPVTFRCVVRQSVPILMVVGETLFMALWQPTLLMPSLVGTRSLVVVNSLAEGILVVLCVILVSVRCSLAEEKTAP